MLITSFSSDGYVLLNLHVFLQLSLRTEKANPRKHHAYSDSDHTLKALKLQQLGSSHQTENYRSQIITAVIKRSCCTVRYKNYRNQSCPRAT